MLMSMLSAGAQTDTVKSGRTSESQPKGTVMLGTYYSDRFVGRKTSNGEIFRQNQYTAAHKTIPMGTYLLVTYPVTNQQIVVRVNDRCPRPGILDMTKLAVHSIGIRGSGRVVVTTLDPSTGYAMWVGQDTLALDAEDYYAFRDRSRSKRISPYPISPYDTEPPKTGKSRKNSEKKKTTVDENVVNPNEDKGLPPIDTLPEAQPVTRPEENVSVQVESTERLYDIELCIVNSQMAAQREVGRLPKELQEKTLFRRNQLNNQVHVILSLGDSRSHAVRTQAMLIDEFPDSCLILHEK
jgi:rare lipoprotein A